MKHIKWYWTKLQQKNRYNVLNSWPMMILCLRMLRFRVYALGKMYNLLVNSQWKILEHQKWFKNTKIHSFFTKALLIAKLMWLYQSKWNREKLDQRSGPCCKIQNHNILKYLWLSLKKLEMFILQLTMTHYNLH